MQKFLVNIRIQKKKLNIINQDVHRKKDSKPPIHYKKLIVTDTDTYRTELIN